MAESRRTCATCGTTNEEDARFCEGCGGSLARVCATCGLEARATARYCRGCGAPLEVQANQADLPVAGPARKTVTVMFADLAGSTTFEEQVDAETARDVIGRYHALLRSTAQRHRAGLTKYIGDGFMAVWGVPEIGAEDAASAVDAAVELQDRFVGLAAQVAEAHGTELALRVAVNTGEVVVGAGDADLVGDALNVGARLEAECPRGQVVVGEETWRATRSRYGYESLGRVQVKGRNAPVAVYQWLGLQPDAADATPFVGRSQEVRRLQSVLDDAIATRAARLVTVVGDPGVGKSRLAAEFIAAQTDTSVIQSRCAIDGTVALAPIVEMLRAHDLETDIPAEVSERDRLLRALNGLATGVPGSVEENFWALRRFIEVLAGSGPVVFVLDDIQWADSLLLDFMEHIVEWIKEVPVLVLALARPELRELRPDLVAASRWVADTIHLDGLDAGATAELAARVLGAAKLPSELLHRLPSSTGGNPLFVRELVGMLAHDGVLVEQPTGWELTIDVDAITIPPTIHALLASRLERLDPADRRVLEIASVVGSDFSVGTVRALARGQADAIKMSLNRLRRLELAQPTGTYVGDEAVWGFHHVLIRDVAYRRLLKSDRAELHVRLADWVEAGGPSVAFEADEMIARHLEAAHVYRHELGEFTEHTSDLALRAARHYSVSARRALDRDELISAGTQAARGSALAAADNTVHAELLLTACEAFLSAGDVTAGAGLVDELERTAGEALAPWATCYRCQHGIYTDPERLLEYDSLLQGAIDEFARRADAAGLAKAHRVRASARLRLGRVGDGELDLFEALIAARQSGDHRQITAALGAAPGAALWGPSPVPKAGGRCLDVVRMQRMTTAAPSLEATSLRHLAVLELLRGRPDKARRMLGDARQIVADLGLRHGLMETELFAGIIELMEGDAVAAEPHFRTALEGLDALGVGADAGQAAALLARSVLAQGRIDGADQYAAESQGLAGHNLKTAIAWRAVRAEILSAQGRQGDAVAMATDAVTVASGTDLVLDHAEACLALSRVLTAAGDREGAVTARDDAKALYTAKEVSISIGLTDEPVATPSEKPVRAATGPRDERTAVVAGRLAVTNDSCRYLPAFIKATKEHDTEGALAWFSDRFVYDDRRRLSGEPVIGLDAMRTAIERVSEQYTHFEFHVLAVRGRRLHLVWSRWADNDGNVATSFYVNETGDDDRLLYHIRFDGDDFESAYRELERRYYAGEGEEFAAAGAVTTEIVLAMNRRDYDRVFGELFVEDFRLENRSHAAHPELSADEFRGTLEELDAIVASSRVWASAIEWLSPSWLVLRFSREATGRDDENYEWASIHAAEIRANRLVSICQFEIDDEAAAFAYAEERVRAAASRLALANRATELLPQVFEALRSHDIDGVVGAYADGFVYDDRRRLSGDAIVGREAMRTAVTQICRQYTVFDFHVFAVRGDRLVLVRSRWSDEAGNATAYMHVFEVDDAACVLYDGRFDEDDFEGAYRELERRYYAGEGAAFAELGAVTTEWITALNQRDYGRLIGELTAPSYRLENRSSSVFGHRTATDVRSSFEDLDAAVGSSLSWEAAVRFLSPTIAVFRFEREAMGHDGESYSWTWLDVCEVRDGRVAAACRFDLDDEDAAFAYADERVRATTSRLAVTNRASERVDNAWRQGTAGYVDSAMALYSDLFVYDDRRRLSGHPIEGHTGLRAAAARINEQYPHSQWRTLAVRGERLELRWSRWWDDAGNETVSLNLHEIDDDGRVAYHGRFDEDDFEGAYRELCHRYWTAEGAAVAESASLVAEFMLATDKGDFDLAFRQLASPELRTYNKSSSVFADRSAGDLRASLEQLKSMVASNRSWIAVEYYLSPEVGVARHEREAIGHDGELYSWTRIMAGEVRDGRLLSMCQFELDDERAAFAHAEDLLRASASRLAISNQASRAWHSVRAAMEAGDADRAAALFADSYVYDDRWAMAGTPPTDVRAACEEILAQYSIFEGEALAVRGESLQLSRTRWANDAGFETRYLHVIETDEDGLVCYYGRFGDDDFDGAYRELERRYFAGEGAAFAEAGQMTIEYASALNNHEWDRLFGELSADGMRIENRSRSGFPNRSAHELRATIEDLDGMFASVRQWHSSTCWLSSTVCVGRHEREAVGRDGERYSWTRLLAFEVRNGQMASMCVFEIHDEEAAFAYADELLRSANSRLTVSNLATRTSDDLWKTMEAREVDAAAALFADSFVYDDRRRLAGNPLGETRAALERILEDYSTFESKTLAVRGESLALGLMHWANDDGFEVRYLTVHEVDDNGRIVYHGRFDEDDFEGAYRELERRYYFDEGASFADAGATQTEWIVALNRGDLDRLFGELMEPGMRFEMHSSSAFPDSSLTEARAAIEDFNARVDWARTWLSALCWVSPTCCVNRTEREAIGPDGERYTWTRLSVVEFRDGRMASECEFDADDEDAAFACAEERIHAVGSRLPLTNSSCDTVAALQNAMRAKDLEGGIGCYAIPCVYDDRRRVSGDPVRNAAGLRLAGKRILAQYNNFEWRTLAVRGDVLSMHSSVWSDDAGNATSYLHVYEVDDAGHFVYEGRFDEDDFENAYQELTRRYCVGEGAAVAEGATHIAKYLMAINRREWDRVFGEMATADMHAVSRSRSGFPDRSVADLRASYEDLCAMVSSVRSWHSIERWISPTVAVTLHEREATGHDGERYEWTRIIVGEFREGRTTHLSEFDVDDEAAAFAYAEERVRRTENR
ncbi:adenylate cyclase [Mycobacterium sp. 852002-51152_SCH6134967]|uniref:AAA family ATPase n=1 Tax=Mycobacterium sp. 852002-51152_SCH6134967 TaxID=1834096 RepID=UPI0008019FAB|nr:adenylate/guanylate cyclase domain-containing protein [Mycobacterium sp. 852002-51152_SCH6134967]OBF97109.1 adenylate cyclase [Mycobacterium sp. 852002-51152_SCH6134967]